MSISSTSIAAYRQLQVYVADGAINPGGLTTWLKDNVVPLVILVIGIGLFATARKGEHSKALTTTGLVLVALMVIALALKPSMGIDVGTWALELITGKKS